MDGLSWQPLAPTRKHSAPAPAPAHAPSASLSLQHQQQRNSLAYPVAAPALAPVPVPARRQHQHAPTASSSSVVASIAAAVGAGAAAVQAAYNAPHQHVQPKLTALPRPILVRILALLPLSDAPNAARAHSNIAAAFSEEAHWNARLTALQWSPISFWEQRAAELINAFPNSPSSSAQPFFSAGAQPATAQQADKQQEEPDDDGFGDFEDASTNATAPTSFFDVDFTPKKLPTASGGTQVLFNSTPYRRVAAPDRHEAYRKVRAYTTLLRPLTSYILSAIPDSYLEARLNSRSARKEISLLGDEVPASPGFRTDGQEDDVEEADDAQHLPAELGSHLLWTHPSLPSPSSLSWNDQVALLTNLVRFVSPTSAHHFQGLRSPPPAFAWQYEDGIWPWPSSPVDAAELLSRLALQGRGADGKSKRTSFAGIWRATDAARHESRGYEAPSRRGGSPPPGTISEEPSPNPNEHGKASSQSVQERVQAHIKRAHQLNIVTHVLLSHATALEQDVLLPFFEGANARKKDAERAAGLLNQAGAGPVSPSTPTPTASSGLTAGATADAIRRAEETMASAADAAWALRRAFIVRDVLEEARNPASQSKSKPYADNELEAPLSQEQQLLGKAVAPGMLGRPPDTVVFAPGPDATAATGSASGISSSSGVAASAQQPAGPSDAPTLVLPPPKLSRATSTELTALGYRLFHTFLAQLPILQRTSSLRRSHDPRSNIVALSLPPAPSSASSAPYSTGADLDFGPMADAFIPALMDALRASLALVRRLFPAREGGQDVDVQLLRRVVDVVLMGEYVDGLMAQIASLERGNSREAGLARWVEDVQGKPPLSLRALPAAFAQAMRVPAVFVPESASGSGSGSGGGAANGVAVPPSTGPEAGAAGAIPSEPALSLEQERTRLRAEDVIYLAFESRMDAYLAHERSWVMRSMNRICARWDGGNAAGGSSSLAAGAADAGAPTGTDEAFLASANPVAAKKSLLTSFKDVLLVPVSVVPRTATFVGGAVVSTFASSRKKEPGEDGLSGSDGLGAGSNGPPPGARTSPGPEKGLGAEAVGGGGYMDFSKGGDGPFGIGDDDDDEDEDEGGTSGAGAGDDGFGYGHMSGARNGVAPATSTFAASEASEWAAADHGVRPLSTSTTATSSLSAGPTSDEGWGDFSSSSAASSISASASTRPTSLATTVGRSSVVSSSANQLAPPLAPAGGSSSGRSTPVPGKLGGSGRSTPQPPARSGTPLAGGKDDDKTALSRLQLLLSLDVALELIHLNRDTVKRIETFRGFPGAYGMRVRQEIEGIAVAFLQTLSDKHLTPGLQKATEQVKAWIPAEHDSSSSSSKNRKKRNEAIAKARMGRATDGSSDEAVEPLVHFFELVHVGDAIQQMVQVYFDQELSRHVDRTDFLNVVVREKKRFEGILDECVAQGLNAGVDGLMGQVDYLMSTRQGPRDYYPEKPEHMDLGNPTEACQDVIRCLKTHCSMLVGSTDKSVLEVFYQEVGLRLYALICKHLKRQIISIDGGFKVIADLNAYHSFVASFLRQAQVVTYFEALKMLGNIYIIDHPRELAQIVRDANMFGGMMSPEELYEFLQARSDFKSIEKAVDKEMYGFKVAEDCVIC